MTELHSSIEAFDTAAPGCSPHPRIVVRSTAQLDTTTSRTTLASPFVDLHTIYSRIDEPQRPRSIDSWLTSIPDSSTDIMFQFPEKYAIPSTPRERPSSRGSLSRMGFWALTPRKLALIAASCFGILTIKFFLSLSDQPVCLGL